MNRALFCVPVIGRAHEPVRASDYGALPSRAPGGWVTNSCALIIYRMGRVRDAGTSVNDELAEVQTWGSADANSTCQLNPHSHAAWFAICRDHGVLRQSSGLKHVHR